MSEEKNDTHTLSDTLSATLPNDLRVLYIDDDTRLLSLVEGQLSVHGIHVDKASSAQEGMQLLEQSDEETRPHIILCDVMMPNQDGYSFHEYVRNNPQWLQIPFIYVTALGEEHDYRKGMNLGADGYLSKPFSHEALLTEIKHVLRRIETMRKDEGTKIHLLGGQNVRINNNLSKAPDRGAEQLVFYLIIQGHKGQQIRRRRNDIMADLWQDITLSGFRSVLSRAKRWSEAWSEWHVTNKEVFFQLNDGIWCDYYEIHEVLDRVGSAKEIEGLYSGILLPNYQEDWVQPKRERLATRVKNALLEHIPEDMPAREQAFALKTVLKVDGEDYALWERYISKLEAAGLQHEADQAKVNLEGQR